jgi:hypothetical protein
MVSIDTWNNFQHDMALHKEVNPPGNEAVAGSKSRDPSDGEEQRRTVQISETPSSVRRTVELVVCTHDVTRNGENVTLMIYRVRLSNSQMLELDYHSATLKFTLTQHVPGQGATPAEVLAWAPFGTQEQLVTDNSNVTSETSMSRALGAEAVGIAELDLGKRWESNFTQKWFRRAISDPHHDEILGVTTGVQWRFAKAKQQDDEELPDFHLAIVVKPPQDSTMACALHFNGRLEVRVKAEELGCAPRFFREDTRYNEPAFIDPDLPAHFCGTGERVHKLLYPNADPLELGNRTEDTLLRLIGVINDYSYTILHSELADMTSMLGPHPTGATIREGEAIPGMSDHDDLLLDALLRPNEQKLRLAKIRAQVASECQVLEISTSSHHGRAAIDTKRCCDLLRRVVRSLNLLQKTGLAQTSLILLADDPARTGIIQAIGLDIRELEDLSRSWVNAINSQPAEPPEELFHAAQRLLRKFGIDPDPDRRYKQLATYCILVAMATVSYAGSHCHPLTTLLGPGDRFRETVISELRMRT